MFEIVQDKVGVHDLLYPPCDRRVYERLGRGPQPGCLENLTGALAPYDIQEIDVPDPFNIFMNTVVDADGRVSIVRPVSKPGDYIALRAEMDCLVCISACPAEHDECNGDACTSIAVEIRSV